MDTLLVNPNNRIVSPFAGIEQPLWLGLIASDMRKNGKEVAILDAEVEDLTLDQTVKRIRDAHARKVIFVVMGNNPSVSSTPKMKVTKALVDILIGDMPLAVTGLHPSALPQQTRAELGIEVLRGKIFAGTPDMPWDLFPMEKYISHNWQCLDSSPRQPYAVIYTSLGCPFSCDFCPVHALYNWQHKVWYRDIDAVVNDIDILVNKYHVHTIKIWDELFTLNEERVNAICDKLIERDYGLNIWAYARVDRVSLNMLRKMQLAGIKWVSFGFESGSDSILGDSHKRASISKAYEAVAMAHSVGLWIGGNFIFGLPHDTPTTMLETLEFAKSLNIEWANFYQAKFYPGSKVYDELGEKADKNWEDYGQFLNKAGKSDYDSFMVFRDRAFAEYYTSYEYRANIRNKFGQQAVDHIDAMLDYGKPVTRSAELCLDSK